MDRFHRSIERAILDENLQAALDANAERRVNGRIAAFASLPDWRERRWRAHIVRARVIDDLDSYLEQFTRNARSNGLAVHLARDAAEAVHIILEIAAGSAAGDPPREPLLFAKSKSMVSEEIGLNHALEAAGHRVVETDLGEYIVQLRGEKPAHIITPAVHLRRNDVGKLFHEKLGISYTEDIPTLTNTARRILREVFLTAAIGVSGVNFGVAETGGLCIVTNEGNGRMITTLPRVHVALMGMERLLRDFDDLALMLSLLPRSATGQKISVYTQILHGPLEGQERHLILLDNGRSRLRNSALRESLYCIRCGACLNACPVFREIGGHAYHSVYPGPIGSVISPGLFGPEYAALAQASSLCGACREACPVDIDLPRLLTRVRAGAAVPQDLLAGRAGQGLGDSLKLVLAVYSQAARNPRLFSLSQALGAVVTHVLSPFRSMFRLPAFTGWGYSKDFPRFAAVPFRRRFVSVPPSPGGPELDAAGAAPAVPAPASPVPAPPADLTGAFCRELNALGGHVTLTRDPTSAISEFLR
ncbi:MAG: lactate utilization protein B, partial [Bacteroidota bacterium]